MKSNGVRLLAVIVVMFGWVAGQGGQPSFAAAGVVGGRVYHDVNNNGVRDAGEVGVANLMLMVGPGNTSTDSTGRWSVNITGAVKIRLVTGWYRSQCNGTYCPVGPGKDQDFLVDNEYITVTANATVGATIDVGIIPDWPSGYPIPATPIAANAVDVSSRMSWIWPSGTPGASNCYRTALATDRACRAGDIAQFQMQVHNEGTQSISNPVGYIRVPSHSELVSATLSVRAPNHPMISAIVLGPIDWATRTIPYTLVGTLPPAASAEVLVKLRVIALDADDPSPYLRQLRLRTELPGDVDGQLCAPGGTCKWGSHSKQLYPDNSDSSYFNIVR